MQPQAALEAKNVTRLCSGKTEMYRVFVSGVNMDVILFDTTVTDRHFRAAVMGVLYYWHMFVYIHVDAGQ
jgi:ABC-type siderophore export system fused ATPase/permease subunit